MPFKNNYVVGRGRLYFERFAEDQTEPTGKNEIYLGNTPSLTLNQDSEQLEHFSSDEGLKLKDASVTLSNDLGGQFTTDNISTHNLALLFHGEEATEAQGSATAQSESITVDRLGSHFQLGFDPANNVMGVQDVSNVAVIGADVKASGTLTFAANPSADDTVTINGHAITFKASGATGAQVNIGASKELTAQALKTYINAHPVQTDVTASGDAAVLTLTAIDGGTAGNSITLAKSGTNPSVSGATLSGGAAGSSVNPTGNFTVDAENGRLYVDEDATDIAAGDTITVTYDVAAGTRSVVVDSDEPTYGALRFIADNPVGTDRNKYWPYVKLSASGDYQLKGDDWQTMTFDFEVLKANDTTRRLYSYAKNA